MNDVAQQGRTVLFVSHDMSAILRLTEEALVLDKGTVAFRAPTQEAVDYYMSSGYSQSGERIWKPEEIPVNAAPFKPIALRIRNPQGVVNDSMRSSEPITVEFEYQLDQALQGLRLGIYLLTSRGEYVFTSFDTDSPKNYEQYASRQAGHYISRCQIPTNLMNEGRFILGVNASSFKVKRFFHDDHSIVFTVDASGAPGKQWAETRLGPLRPDLNWQIEEF